MTRLIIGALGQLGTALNGCLDGDCLRWDLPELDITDAEAVEQRLEEVRPEVVMNCAAYNLVDQAEQEPELAYRINALGPLNLARACARLDCELVHISTDYVFGMDRDRRQPWTEQDAPCPHGPYAVSKLAGEYYVRAYCPRHFVVRTCGLYGHASVDTKGNFIRTMLRLGGERDRLNVVADQHCTPTSTRDLAEAVVDLVPSGRYGLYHCTNAGATTWCDLAAFVLDYAGLRVQVEPITTEQFGAVAERPRYSVLDCSRLQKVIGRTLPDWKQAARHYVDSLETQ